MSPRTVSPENPHEFVENRLRRSIEGRSATRSIGLVQVIGTHGTGVQTVFDLAKNGKFSSGTDSLADKFHLTPNLSFSGWKKTEHAKDVQNIINKIGLINPIETAVEYAENISLRAEDMDDYSFEGLEDEHLGVVIAFGRQALKNVELVDLDIVTEKPEAVLSIPEMGSINAIYPIDKESEAKIISVLQEL